MSLHCPLTDANAENIINDFVTVFNSGAKLDTIGGKLAKYSEKTYRSHGSMINTLVNQDNDLLPLYYGYETLTPIQVMIFMISITIIFNKTKETDRLSHAAEYIKDKADWQNVLEYYRYRHYCCTIM